MHFRFLLLPDILYSMEAIFCAYSKCIYLSNFPLFLQIDGDIILPMLCLYNEECGGHQSMTTCHSSSWKRLSSQFQQGWLENDFLLFIKDTYSQRPKSLPLNYLSNRLSPFFFWGNIRSAFSLFTVNQVHNMR